MLTPVVGSEKVHVLALPLVRHECHDAAIAVRGQGEAGLLLRFAQSALLRALALFKLAADADPLVAIAVVLLFRAVQHQVFAAAFDINERRVHGAIDATAHDTPSPKGLFVSIKDGGKNCK